MHCPRGDPFPSRDGFFQELLSAQPTARTSQFDDYTADSYHVIKLDVARGFPTQALACGASPRAVLIVGPVGALWTYYVAALVEEGPNIRVNAVEMPHARIIEKRTGLVALDQALALLRDLESAPLVLPGLPTPTPDDRESDFSYRVLMAVFGAQPPEYFHADFNEFSGDRGSEPLLASINALLHTATTQTYDPDTPPR